MNVHRYAVALALATFVLLIFGGLVSTTESGLACPDWPLCEGKYIPKLENGKQFEHTHRLVASFVGVMTFGMAALLFKHRRRDKLLVRLGFLAVLLVIAQALLGAITVWLKLPWYISSAHLATAMSFFAVAVSLAFLTRQRINNATPDEMTFLAQTERASLLRKILPVVALVFIQLVAGALMRHLRGGLACGYDFPLCLGSVWPLDGHLGIQLHMIHRSVGILCSVAVIALAVSFVRANLSHSAEHVWLKRVAVFAAVLVLVQIGLGIATILTSRDLIVMTFHSSMGALLWASMISMIWLAAPIRAVRSNTASTHDVNVSIREVEAA